MSMSQVPSPSQRLGRAAAADNMGDPCTTCGSFFFADLVASKYTVSSYGARSVGNGTQSALICVGCGEPLVPPNLKNASAGTDREAFYKSLLSGVNYRAKQKLGDSAKNLVSIAELEALREIVLNQQEIIEGLLLHMSGEEESESESEPELEAKPEETTTEKITRVRGRNTPNV